MSERISEVRVTSGNHPVSSMVRRKADAVHELALELTAAAKSGQIVDANQLAARLQRLVGDLRRNVAPAVQHLEEMGASQMGVCK